MKTVKNTPAIIINCLIFIASIVLGCIATYASVVSKKDVYKQGITKKISTNGPGTPQ